MMFLRKRPQGDEGIAIVIAVAVMAVALTLSLVVVQVAVTETRSSGVDRQRAVAINAAESGLDAAYVSFQTSQSALPCPEALPSLEVSGLRDAPQVTTDVHYYRTDNTEITSCSELQANLGHKTMTALITSTATTNTLGGGTTRGERSMQSYVTLRPIIANGFDNAIFANGALTVNNNHMVRGNIGNDADIYSNGDISCPNGSNQTYQGGVFAQGTISFDGQCSALGDVWAKGNVSLGHNQTTVGGRVISSEGSVSVSGVSGVSGTVMAGTTISPTSCVAPKCVRGIVQGAPPVKPFPQISKSLISQWTATPSPGYTQTTWTDCTTIKAKIIEKAKLTSPQLIDTPCKVAFSKDNDIPLSTDVVIFADGGFDSSQQVTFTSKDGVLHKLYWIVPYEQYSATCSKDITTDNNFGIDSNVDLLMYTPCNVNMSNHADHIGQVFGGGNVTVTNRFDMQFRPLPVFGVNPTSLPLLSYDVDIIYKREVRG